MLHSFLICWRQPFSVDNEMFWASSKPLKATTCEIFTKIKNRGFQTCQWYSYPSLHELNSSYYQNKLFWEITDSTSIYQMSIIEHSLIAWAYKHQMCHTPLVYILLSCTDLENTTNLYKKFPKYQRYASLTNGPASKEVPESAIETQLPAQKPATKCS